MYDDYQKQRKSAEEAFAETERQRAEFQLAHGGIDVATWSKLVKEERAAAKALGPGMEIDEATARRNVASRYGVNLSEAEKRGGAPMQVEAPAAAVTPLESEFFAPAKAPASTDMPAVAAFGPAAAPSGPEPKANQSPIKLNITSQLHLDGKVLSEELKQYDIARADDSGVH